jgi:hypothetical protein
MALWRVYLLPVAMIVLLAGFLDAQPTQGLTATIPGESAVSLTPEKQEVEVGELIDLVGVIAGSGVFNKADMTFPESQSKALIVESVNFTDERTFVARFRALREIPEAIGPATIKAWPDGGGSAIEIESNTFFLKVVPPEGEATFEVNGYTETLSLGFNYLLRNLIVIMGAVVLIIVLTLLVWFLSRGYLKRLQISSQPPPTPPVVQALEEIRSLANLQVFGAYGPERHYTILSNIVRTYVEHELKERALEMTEDEMIDLLRDKLAELPGSIGLVDVMSRSSMAKFARQQLTEVLAKQDCATAEEFFLAEKQRISHVERQKIEFKAVKEKADDEKEKEEQIAS